MNAESLINLTIVFLVAAGHLLIVREVLQRFGTVRMPYRVWVFLSGVHVALGVVVPVALVMKVGRHGARVLRGGHWLAAPVGWQVYAAACVAAFVAAAATS